MEERDIDMAWFNVARFFLKKKTAITALVTLPVAAHCATLQEQALCAAYAEKFFNRHVAEQTAVDPKLGALNELVKYDSNTFVSHYDAASQKCFVGIETHYHTPGGGNNYTFWTRRIVADAIGGGFYGYYLWHTVKEKKYWEVEPMQCDVTPLTLDEKKLCHSDEEFQQLVRANLGVFF
jgi:hypothetical protein